MVEYNILNCLAIVKCKENESILSRIRLYPYEFSDDVDKRYTSL